MKEIEIKILEIDVVKLRAFLRRHAVFVKNVFQQNFFYKNEFTKKKKVVVRLRKEGKLAVLTVKANRRIVHGHKIVDEYEMQVDFKTAQIMLKNTGFRNWAITELKREYWKYNGCSVEVCRLPGIPAFLEIEGTPKSIDNVAHALGFSKKEYMVKSIFKHYKIKEKEGMFLRF